jgi:hypothetical protein
LKWWLLTKNATLNLAVSGVQYGTEKDKTISRSDSAILHVRKEGTTFKYYKEDGSVAKERDTSALLMEDTTFGWS